MKLANKRKQYDSVNTEHDGQGHHFLLTPERHTSPTVIAAYRVGFALIYGKRISPSGFDLRELGMLIPAVVDFADAYGLLPAFNYNINSLIFGYDWDGYDLVAANPFQMLRVSCKLESETIYKEAMKHAVALHHRFAADGFGPCYTTSFFDDIGESELQKHFNYHAQAFREELDSLSKYLLIIQPGACEKIGTAKHIGIAIYRDWIIDNMVNPGSQTSCYRGVLDLLEKTYDVSDIIGRWSTKDWQKEVGVRFGHVHRAVEDYFRQAAGRARWVLCPENAAKGLQAAHILQLSLQEGTYLANLPFDGRPDESALPWAGRGTVNDEYDISASKTGQVKEGDTDVAVNGW